MNKPLKVKVLTCSEPNFWYKDYIGKVFKVLEYNDNTFQVLNKPRHAVDYVRLRELNWDGNLFLQKRDCEDEFFSYMRSVLDE